MTNTAKKGKAAPSQKTKTSTAAVAKRKQNVRARSTGTKAAAKSKPPPRKPKLQKSNGTSKANQIVKLLQRKGGASIAEIQKASGWQPHSVRGFLSGTVKKRMGHDLRSEKSTDGVRRYIIGAS